MWFDVHRALLEIENDGQHVAKPAIPANQQVRLAELASLASLQHHRSSIAITDASEDALDAYEERVAIRVFDGGQPRAEAEAAALIEAANGAGLDANTLRRVWAEHPDAIAYLSHLSATGPKTCGDAAAALKWNSMRAWQAEARLRAAGLVKLDGEGRASICREEQPA